MDQESATSAHLQTSPSSPAPTPVLSEKHLQLLMQLQIKFKRQPTSLTHQELQALKQLQGLYLKQRQAQQPTSEAPLSSHLQKPAMAPHPIPSPSIPSTPPQQESPAPKPSTTVSVANAPIAPAPQTTTFIPTGPPPSYLHLLTEDKLEARIRRLKMMFSPCRMCPHACSAKRINDYHGACTGGLNAAIANFCIHHGEEPPISGKRGSGAVFFYGCTMRCAYCQNYQVSQCELNPKKPLQEYTAEAFAEAMLNLQSMGCHNLNLVTPSHYAYQILCALDLAARKGFRLPLVFNTNGFDSIQTLQMLEGVVDIYLPDFKYNDDKVAHHFSRIYGYVNHAEEAIAEMWRQVGPLTLDKHDIAYRGMIVRHLVLPGQILESEMCLRRLHKICGVELTISLMAQYRPMNKVDEKHFAEINRKLEQDEYNRVVDLAEKLGFSNVFIQEVETSPDYYVPNFDQEHPFEDPEFQSPSPRS